MPPTTAQLVHDQGLGQLLNHRDIDLKGMAAPQRVARAEVRAVLEDHADPGRIEDALLVTSELVNNSLTHAGGPVNLTVDLYEYGATVGILDCVGNTRPAVTAPVEADLSTDHAPVDLAMVRDSGRGMFLVNAFATAWSVEEDEGGGKRVVAIFSLLGGIS